jgi:penicillin-binding protein 1A
MNRILNLLLAVYGIVLMALLLMKRALSILKIHKPSPPTPSYYAKLIWRNFLILVFAIGFYFQAVDMNLFWLFGKSPGIADLEKPKVSEATEIYSADNVLLGKYFRENRSSTEYSQVSPNVIKALLATEDINFANHNGIDLGATVSIFYYMLKGDKRGGSTITQQLAKNLYKTRKRENLKGVLSSIPGLKTLVEKTKEWLTAIKLERAYTKEEILKMYLNTVDFGSSSFGIRTAAESYFHTTPGRLKMEEAAVLIGMLKATTTYNPRKNYQKALQRRNVVLGQMRKYGFLSKSEQDSLCALPIQLRHSRETHPDGVLDYYGNFLTRKLNEWADSSGYDIYGDGLRIQLTIDTKIQQMAREAVEEQMRLLQRRFNEHWKGQNPWRDDRGREIPDFLDYLVKRTGAYKSLVRKYGGRNDSINFYLNKPRKMLMFTWNGPDTMLFSTIDSLRYCKKLLHTGFMVMNPYKGKVMAWIGGINYDFFKYDHVQQSVRQPGSTFKAFVYGAAMENGFLPCHRIPDRHIRYEYDEDSAGIKVHRKWTPTNAGGGFSGRSITLRHAIGRSINSVAVQLTAELGKQKAEKEGEPISSMSLAVQRGAGVVADFARKCGISTPLDVRPSIGLGSSDVCVYDMVGAYSVFLNSGFWQEPTLVAVIKDKKGKIIREFIPPAKKVMSEEAAYKMVHMLRGTIEEPMGTAQNLYDQRYWVPANDCAGKTGTSSNQSDGWFMGMTKDFVGGAWVGAEERSVHFRSMKMGEGSKTALPIFGLFMKKYYAQAGITKGRFPKKDIKLGNCKTAAVRKRSPSAASPGPAADPAPAPEESVLE